MYPLNVFLNTLDKLKRKNIYFICSAYLYVSMTVDTVFPIWKNVYSITILLDQTNDLCKNQIMCLG